MQGIEHTVCFGRMDLCLNINKNWEAVVNKWMIKIRYVEMIDKLFWYQLDKHLPEAEFENKVKTKRGYVLLENDSPVGLLWYNLFGDNVPFCTMLFIDEKVQGKGYGSMLMNYWEEDMKKQEYGMLLTSTRVDETAQHS